MNFCSCIRFFLYCVCVNPFTCSALYLVPVVKVSVGEGSAAKRRMPYVLGLMQSSISKSVRSSVCLRCTCVAFDLTDPQSEHSFSLLCLIGQLVLHCP